MDRDIPRGLSRRPSGQTLGILLVVVSACGFGSGALFVQPLYDADMEPLVVLFWRFFSAALLSWGFLLAARRGRRSLRALPARRVAILLLLGAIYVGNSGTYIASLQVVPISLSSIITYIYPALVAVMATRFVRRLEGRRAWVALGLSMLGVALAVGGVPEGALPPLWGLALAFASPVIYAVWIVLQARLAGDRPARARRAQQRRSAEVEVWRAEVVAEVAPAEGEVAPAEGEVAVAGAGAEQGPSGQVTRVGVVVPPADAEAAAGIPDPAPAAALMTSATAAVFGVLVLGTGRSISPLDVPGDAWWPLLGLGLVATAIAIQAFYAGVRRVGGARAALISTVEPIYTIVLAMLLFGERLSPLQIVGGILVIGAVILAETGRPRDEVASRPAEPDRVGPTAPASGHTDG